MNIAEEFEVSGAIAYLNHAAVAPWPTRTKQAVVAFAEENASSGAQHYERWLKTERSLRLQLCQLINVPSVDDVALQKNTSEALSAIAYGLDWNAGDNVVLCAQEFPSNRIVWESLRQFGVEVRLATLAGRESPEEALMELVDQSTRLISVSSVQYGSGLTMNIEQLGAFCRDEGVLFCVDAIQSLGAHPYDNEVVGADFIVADGHKWMLGPEGLALFYCKPELRERLALHQYGWHMVQDHSDFNQPKWDIAHSARRFECGSPNMLGTVALNASISLLLEVGIDTVAAQLNKRVQQLIQQLNASDQIEILSDTNPDRLTGIVTFKHRTVTNETLFSSLRQANVVCAMRGSGIRFSPHFYTPTEAIDRAVAVAVSS